MKLIDKVIDKVRILTEWTSGDRTSDEVSNCMDAHSLTCLLQLANGGDPSAQAKLGCEIEEKDWDVMQALQTRRLAVLGAPWKCLPAKGQEEDPRAIEIAEKAEEMLGAISGGEAIGAENTIGLDGLLEHLLKAILPGYSIAEIIWEPGGASISGFLPREPAQVTFENSKLPLLKVEQGDAIALEPNKWVWHCHNTSSGDKTRGGLIRPLGWMFLIWSLGIRDLARFVEKFGMPFMVARVDQDNWDKNRFTILDMIKNFGSDGGGVFGKGVETEVVQASNNGGEIYFTLLEYFYEAKTRCILGQLASSSDASGMSNGGAQDEVRRDILAADQKSLGRTITQDILTPWTAFVFGPDAPVPSFEIGEEETDDLASLCEIVSKLRQAGYAATPEWVTNTFNIPIVEIAASSEEALSLVGERPLSPQRLASTLMAQRIRPTSATAMASMLDPLGPVLDEMLSNLPEDGDEIALAAWRDTAVERLESDALWDALDPSALTELLTNAMLSGNANGREEAIANIKETTR